MHQYEEVTETCPSVQAPQSRGGWGALARASFNIATSGVSAPVGPSSGPVVKQKNLILPQ